VREKKGRGVPGSQKPPGQSQKKSISRTTTRKRREDGGIKKECQGVGPKIQNKDEGKKKKKEGVLKSSGLAHEFCAVRGGRPTYLSNRGQKIKGLKRNKLRGARGKKSRGKKKPKTGGVTQRSKKNLRRK